MSYRDKVQAKIGASVERSEERKEIWQKISTAYEPGGVDRVESSLTEEMERLKVRFREAIEKLQKML